MPAMLRKKGLATKIAEKILGVPVYKRKAYKRR